VFALGVMLHLYNVESVIETDAELRCHYTWTSHIAVENKTGFISCLADVIKTEEDSRLVMNILFLVTVVQLIT